MRQHTCCLSICSSMSQEREVSLMQISTLKMVHGGGDDCYGIEDDIMVIVMDPAQP